MWRTFNLWWRLVTTACRARSRSSCPPRRPRRTRRPRPRSRPNLTSTTNLLRSQKELVKPIKNMPMLMLDDFICLSKKQRFRLLTLIDKVWFLDKVYNYSILTHLLCNWLLPLLDIDCYAMLWYLWLILLRYCLLPMLRHHLPPLIRYRCLVKESINCIRYKLLPLRRSCSP